MTIDQRTRTESPTPVQGGAPDALDAQIGDLEGLLGQHQRNRLRLLGQKAIYASGEEQLRHLNQIEAEEIQIVARRSELGKLLEQKLVQLVADANLKAEDLQWLHERSRPQTFAQRLGPISLPAVAVATLWGMRDEHDKALPIIEFVERLARHLQDNVRTQTLRNWNHQMVMSGVLPVQIEDLALLAEWLDSTQSQQERHLIVEVTPVSTKPIGTVLQRYRLQLYLWQGEDRRFELWDLPNGDQTEQALESHTWDEILKRINWVLNELEENAPKTIEFLLPFDLLIQEIDQWKFQISAEDELVSKLCERYTVIVRSQERIRGPKQVFGLARQEWRKLWKLYCAWMERTKQATLPEPAGTEAPIITWLCRPDDYDAKDARQRLFDDLTRNKRKGICLTLTFTPPVGSEVDRKGNLLRTILLAGVPILLWSRKHPRFGPDYDAIKAELEPILAAEHLPELPLIIQQLRTCEDAYDHEEHMGNHLTLFWDDPNMVPPARNRDMSGL